MSIRQIAGGVLLAALAVPAAAQEVAGKWDATVESPQGEFSMTFDFAVDGDELTGTMSNEFMGDVPISDGMVDGNEVSFKISMEGGPGGAMTISYKGMVEGDELALTSVFEGGAPGGGPAEQTLTATRAAE